MSGDRGTISFEGGPVDGDEIHGWAARAVADWDPPFVCFSIDGRDEHYVRVDDGRYQHAGSCRALADGGQHPPCGHDHKGHW